MQCNRGFIGVGNQQGIKLFVVLLFCTIFIYSFSHFGVLAYNATTSSGDEFKEGTFIGSLNVSGKSKSEATTALAEEVAKWRTETKIELFYKEKNAPIDLAIFNFELEGSVTSAVNGTANPVIVSINQHDLRQAYKLISPDLSIEDVNEDTFGAELSTYPANLSIGTFKVQLENHMNDSGNNEVISQAEITLKNTIAPVAEGVQKLSSIKIEPRSQISLTDLFASNDMTEFSNEAKSIIASGIYEAILPTNFIIVERNISLNLPQYAKLGYEALVNEDKNLGFSFANPNESSYEIKLSVNANVLNVELFGSPFLYEYRILLGEQEKFKPKKIIQYSPQLKPNAVTIKQPGQDGIQMKVYREVYDENGSLLRTETISDDFYPPVHQIEIHGLKSTSSPASGENNETGTKNDGSTDEGTNQQNPDSTTEPADSESEDKLWAKPSEPK